MRVFRIAIPASQIDRSREFYEVMLGVEADVTVPSRVYFHCGDVIVAVIDWAVEPLGPFRSTPENLYFATDDLDAAYRRAKDAGAANSPRSNGDRGASVRSTASTPTAIGSVSSTTRPSSWVAALTGLGTLSAGPDGGGNGHEGDPRAMAHRRTMTEFVDPVKVTPYRFAGGNHSDTAEPSDLDSVGRTQRGSRGRPRTRSPRMLRITFEVPPMIV